MNDVTRSCNNTQIKNNGGEESIALGENTTRCHQSLFLTLIQKQRVERDGSISKLIANTFLWHRKSVEYNHTKVFCNRRIEIKTAVSNTPALSDHLCCAEGYLNNDSKKINHNSWRIIRIMEIACKREWRALLLTCKHHNAIKSLL